MTIKKRLTLALALMLIIPILAGAGLGRLLFTDSKKDIEAMALVLEANIQYKEILASGGTDNWEELAKRFPEVGILINYENGNNYISSSWTKKLEKNQHKIFDNQNKANCTMGIPFAEGDFYSNSQNSTGHYTLYYDPFLGMEDQRVLGLIYFLILLAIVIITDIILSLYLHQSLARPFKKLDTSARLMAEGDLDTSVIIKNKDEIGDLSQTFDEMRQRLKKSLQKQQKYEENRKELVASISHDLRTPLSAIKGYVEGLKDGVAGTPQKQEKYLNIILKKTEDLDHLIEKLFFYSKMELYQTNINPKPTNLNSFLKSYFEERQEDYPLMEINLDIPKELEYTVLLDKLAFRRVLCNVVDNAYLYNSQEKKKLSVKLYKKDFLFYITISDNGDGIPEEYLKLVFEQFFRVDKSRNTEKGSSGLGLSIAKKIVESHGGSITANSLLPQGISIEIILPEKKLV